MPSSFAKGSKSCISRLPPTPCGSPRRPYQHAAISLGLPGQADPHPFIISVFPAGLSTGHAPILPWRKDRKVRPGLRNATVYFPKGSLQPTCWFLSVKANPWAGSIVRPDNTSRGGEEKGSVQGPARRQVARALKPQTPRKLSAKAFPRKSEGGAVTNFLVSDPLFLRSGPINLPQTSVFSVLTRKDRVPKLNSHPPRARPGL